MSLIKVDENNTFEWKVNHDADKYVLFSDDFTIDGYSFCLSYMSLHFFRYGPQPQLSNVREFCLESDDAYGYLLFSYTISIHDQEGQDIICTKGKIMMEKDRCQWPLMILDYDKLRERNIDRSSFTVRVSVNLVLNDRERPSISKAEALNVIDSASNTNPLVTKDSSTNTAEASNVADSSTNTDLFLTKNSSTNTDVSATFLETLSNDFSTFFESKTDTDCVLKVSDAQFCVHRSVLSARSSVFSAMFHHDTAESSSGEVNIQDIKATILSDVLYYVYSGKIRGLTDDTATSIYIAADKYDLLELRKECLVFLKRNLTMNNFCEAALLSHMHGEVELEERVLRFIEDNLDDVLESNRWQQFSKDKTLLALRLLTSALKDVKKK